MMHRADMIVWKC